MKKFLLPLALVVLLTGCPKGNDKISHKTMFTFDKDETLYYNEYATSLHFDNDQFILVAEDTMTHMMTLVWNGERKVKGYNIHAETINLDFFEECKIFYSSTGDDSPWNTLIFGDRKYGPYESVDPSCWLFDDPKCIHNDGLRFSFLQNGNEYFYDTDGKVVEAGNHKTLATSPSEEYQADFDPENLTVSISNTDSKETVYQLDLDKSELSIFNVVEEGGADNALRNNLYAFDDGSAYISLQYYDITKRSYGDYAAYLHDGEVTTLGVNEYFDFYTHEIVDSYPYDDFRDRPNFFGYYDNTLTTPEGDTYIIDWDNYCLIVNDEKVCDTVPVQMFYDEGENKFVWFVLEGNQLVKYNYDLKKKQD